MVQDLFLWPCPEFGELGFGLGGLCPGEFDISGLGLYRDRVEGLEVKLHKQLDLGFDLTFLLRAVEALMCKAFGALG